MKYFYERFLQPLFFCRQLYWLLTGVAMVFVISFGVPLLFPVAQMLLAALTFLVLIDYLILFLKQAPLQASRVMAERFSLGDENSVELNLVSGFPFTADLEVRDELPVQFQARNFLLRISIKKTAALQERYLLKPLQRGEYYFGNINILVTSPLKLVRRNVVLKAPAMIRVFPSYFHIRQFELMAYTSNLSETGNRRVRKLGHSLEFEQIKEYISGDDIRNINWKATARKGELMVNHFTDEKSQQIYCLIDKGRAMKMPFEGITLLDYAINAALMLSKVALIKQDKAGIVTFGDKTRSFLVADRKAGQMNNIVDLLYNQQTDFLETDYEKMFALVKSKIPQRSLVILFTNFESLSGLEHQLSFIRGLAARHLVLVVFFENTELSDLINKPADSLEELYIKTIAEKFAYEKRLMVKALQQHGIMSILSAPGKVTVNTVNKYLELKARQAI